MAWPTFFLCEEIRIKSQMSQSGKYRKGNHVSTAQNAFYITHNNMDKGY